MNEAKKESQKVLWRLIITYLAYVGTILIWFGIFGMAYMAFDSKFSWFGLIFFLIIASYLPAIIWATIASWRKYKQKEFKKAKIIAAAPFIYPILFMLLIRFG